MADMISIPSQFEFKELLSHTFPGFFSAISLFMLMDYFSPYDLTTFAIGSFNGLIAFIGLIIVLGTIIGVIIDGIHHAFIEDRIFDNLEYINSIKSPIKNRLKMHCSTHGDHLTRRYFFKSLGDKAISIDEHLDKGYYRYSEFYSNIFMSLILFSIVSPLYLFGVLRMPWRASIIFGALSLIVAGVCLFCSIILYKDYLEAHFSVLCGFSEAKRNCSYCPNEVKGDIQYDFWIKIILIPLSIFIPFLIVYVFYKPLEPLTYLGLTSLVLILLVILDRYLFSKYLSKKGEPTLADRFSRVALGTLTSFIGSIFILMIVLTFSFIPYSANVVPLSVHFEENITDNSSIAEPITTLVFQNSGKQIKNLTLNLKGINSSWINLTDNSGNNKIQPPDHGEYKITNIPTMDVISIGIRLNSSSINVAENTIPGSYIGVIEFRYREGRRWILNEDGSGFPDITIPIYINLTKRTKYLSTPPHVPDNTTTKNIHPAIETPPHYGDTPVTIASRISKGYQIFLDGKYIGKEGTSGDAPDGKFSFFVAGNKNHSINIFDGQFSYSKDLYFQKGAEKTIDVPN